ncbi:sensor histidine kinase [Dawidia soli]|uniref:histidine kinase n=1 Tax=Dawidia soli TaxID=2782352 RepID=A0AAP2D4Z1_9BACT|nr:ATP-binding protein [Dawidia soli]MBT1685139.1 PAS domain-containing protein [Dawidia soli]
MIIFPQEVLYSKVLIGSLIKVMQEALLVLNASDEIEIANQAAADIFGSPEAEHLLQRNIRELYASPEDADKKNAFFREEGHSDKWEDPFVRDDGRVFVASYSITVTRDTESGKLFKIILLQDVSEQRRYTQMIAEYTHSLEKNNKELDQFAYIVSHDLKAPLRAISNLSSWLEDDLGPSLSGENKDNLATLRGRVKRMEALINGILEYSKVGRENVASETVDVNKLLEDIVELLSPPPHIRVNILPAMPCIETPRILLHQVFSNLISNAIKYNDKEAGRVSVGFTEKESAFEFWVEDNGPGISPEYHETIFVIFRTLQARDKYESTGIGLTIVKRILAAVGGTINVESKVEEGSKFIFTWPKTNPEQRNHEKP